MLHVEDEVNGRAMIRDLLEDEVELTSVGSAEEALEAVEAQSFDLTLLDWTLPGRDGGSFLNAVREGGRAGRVVVLTALGTAERAVEALRAGAYDFLVKPADPADLLTMVEKAKRSVDLIGTATRARPRVASRAGGEILGRSPEILDLKDRLGLVASADAPVLITGESGTGKELVARSLHEASGRHRARLVTLNCAAIPPSLFESELFGHKRGSFTGASGDRAGLVELAQGGTLFLDEVGELPLEAQAKLLRVLQEREVRRVGESKVRAVDLRVISATNRDLDAEVARGTFREDLLYRLDVVRLEVPPLRERSGDVLPLLEHFLARQAAAWDRPVPKLDAAARARLERHPWPGNIRELENAAKRMVILGVEVALAELERARARAQPSKASSADVLPETAGLTLKEAVRVATRAAILSALQATKGSRTEAAKALGVSRKTLFNKCRDLGIQEETHWS
jgi:two-component system, NtrC family, response regulator AtoC